MRTAILCLLLCSCAHLPTLADIQRGLRECAYTCRIADQPIARYNIETGQCVCGGETPSTPAVDAGTATM